jgi:hypothetical protein
VKTLRKILTLTLLLLFIAGKLNGQFLMDMVDTTKNEGKGLLGVYKRYDRLKIGGYIQPQFQIGSMEGTKSFEGGDFGQNVSNRFMLRRSRVRFDYIYFGANRGPGVQIVFQFDASEKGFTVRDVWGRVFENRFKLFSFTTGMFARPFGYEVNYSSADRESPERGRMSQTLMKGERDLGAMISFGSRRNSLFPEKIKVDIGLFNGQGILSTGDFDNIKDFIGRISIKPVSLSKKVQFSAGVSTLQGGLTQNTSHKYSTGRVNGIITTVADSSSSNLFRKSPRAYFGSDAQLKIKNNAGSTELRAEFIVGQQTGTINSSETPVELLQGTNGYYVRQFSGAYFYVVQSLLSEKHQLILKYDWYDPNTRAGGKDIGAAGSTLTSANIKYSTLGFGYLHYINDNVKLILYYAGVFNEKTLLNGYTSDVPDDIMTVRMQFRF